MGSVSGKVRSVNGTRLTLALGDERTRPTGRQGQRRGVVFFWSGFFWAWVVSGKWSGAQTGRGEGVEQAGEVGHLGAVVLALLFGERGDVGEAVARLCLHRGVRQLFALGGAGEQVDCLSRA